MASYFVARRPQPDGIHAVHDRSRCPPACFAGAATDYLGDFESTTQAVTVARLRYVHARGCACCDPVFAAPPESAPLDLLRS